MPVFSNSSKKQLGTCHQDLREIFELLIGFFDLKVIEGQRPQELQDRYYAEGKSKLPYPGSKHNAMPSNAIDAAPHPIEWVSKDLLRRVAQGNGTHAEIMKAMNALLKWYHFAGMVKGIAWAQGKNIRWGGDWDGDFDFLDQNFDDLPHFERVE